MVARILKILFIIICIIQLFYLFQYRSGFKYEIIKNPFDKNAGISFALSPEVIESNDILIRQKANDFKLSENLAQDTYFYQRSIEFNFPIRINNSSKLIFFHIEEDIPNTCKIIETGKYLQLTQC